MWHPKRNPCYPGRWAWEQVEKVAFLLAQVGFKEIYDYDTLGPELMRHLRRYRLPRYQWTFLEGLARLRSLAFSHERNITDGIRPHPARKERLRQRIGKESPHG